MKLTELKKTFTTVSRETLTARKSTQDALRVVIGGEEEMADVYLELWNEIAELVEDFHDAAAIFWAIVMKDAKAIGKAAFSFSYFSELACRHGWEFKIYTAAMKSAHDLLGWKFPKTSISRYRGKFEEWGLVPAKSPQEPSAGPKPRPVRKTLTAFSNAFKLAEENAVLSKKELASLKATLILLQAKEKAEDDALKAEAEK